MKKAALDSTPRQRLVNHRPDTWACQQRTHFGILDDLLAAPLQRVRESDSLPLEVRLMLGHFFGGARDLPRQSRMSSVVPTMSSSVAIPEKTSGMKGSGFSSIAHAMARNKTIRNSGS